MEGFSIFLIAVGVFYRSVIGDSSLQDNQEAKHSPALFLTLKLIDDMYDLKKEVVELKNGISDSKISNNELISQNNNLKIEVNGLKDTINLLEGTLNSYVRQRQDGKGKKYSSLFTEMSQNVICLRSTKYPYASLRINLFSFHRFKHNYF